MRRSTLLVFGLNPSYRAELTAQGNLAPSCLSPSTIQVTAGGKQHLQVIETANKLFLITVCKHVYLLYCAGVGPAYETDDPGQFMQHMEELMALGGGDEPEMCLSAIQVHLDAKHSERISDVVCVRACVCVQLYRLDMSPLTCSLLVISWHSLTVHLCLRSSCSLTLPLKTPIYSMW